MRLTVELTIGANRQGLRGFQADQDNVRIVIFNPSSKTVTVSSIGFLGKDSNGISLLYPQGLLVKIWVNAKELKADEDSIVLHPRAEAVIVARIGLIGDVDRCNALQVSTNGKYRKVMKLSKRTLSDLQSANDRSKRELNTVTGRGSSSYLEDCTKGVELFLPLVSTPITSEDEPRLIGRLLLASEQECFAVQAAQRKRAKFDDADHMQTNYGASGKSIYDYHVEDAVMSTFMIEQRRGDELGKDWRLEDKLQSLGRAYRTHAEADCRYREWYSIAESRRLSIYNQLTQQEDVTEKTRALISAHKALCDTCKILSRRD